MIMYVYMFRHFTLNWSSGRSVNLKSKNGNLTPTHIRMHKFEFHSKESKLIGFETKQVTINYFHVSYTLFNSRFLLSHKYFPFQIGEVHEFRADTDFLG
jgi:hypothetical protein